MRDEYISKTYIPDSMSSRPGYTSGRGATTTDLDSKKLKHIYNEILEHQGFDASKSFIEMVRNLKVASCTEFLLSLYRLETSDWKYTDGFFSSEGSSDVYVENEGEAMGTVFAAMGGPRGDDTLQIVYRFLNEFGLRHITDDGRYRNHYDMFMDRY